MKQEIKEVRRELAAWLEHQSPDAQRLAGIIGFSLNALAMGATPNPTMVKLLAEASLDGTLDAQLTSPMRARREAGGR